MTRRVPEFIAAGLIGAVVLGAGSAATGAQERASIPDFTGFWGRNAFDPEFLPSGPNPVANMNRKDGDTMHPSLGGDPLPLVGDYNNPILKPEAAAVVKQTGEIAAGGKIYPDPSNQCAPYSPPYIFTLQLGLQMLQGKDHITMLYQQDDQVRRVRLNASHPKTVKPSAMGDSVGHYEGDTLVIDTVGVKIGPVTMVDRYGTPQSAALHLVERYRLIDVAEAKAAMDRHEKRAGRVGGPPGAIPMDPEYGKALQLQYTVEDPNVFTMPWSAQITYRLSPLAWQEQICAENIVEYWPGMNKGVPRADRPDF
ncbi:MAG TPA: hypothetical protein VGM72_13610 [Micropepsaceae bacterium]